jgi:long-chain acyl-CoA synthetase
MTTDPARPWLDSYAPGVPHEIDEQTGSLPDLIAESVAAYPTNIALEFFGATTTYAKLGDEIDRAAEGLRALGITAGDPVALVLPNCPQHVVAFYAVLRLGGIVVEHNPLYTPRELRHQFEDHGAKFVIAWEKVVETIQDFPADLLPTIIAVDITRGMSLVTQIMLRLPVARARESRAALTTRVSGVIPWKQIVESAPIADSVAGPSVNDVAVIQYTSGTTGFPKGAALTHLNLAANAAQARAWVPTVPRGSSVVYAVLPLFHAYGLTLCLAFAMSMGSRLVLFPRFDPELVLSVVKKRPPTFLPAVPPIYERLMAAAAEKGVSLDGIQIAISGAMPLRASVVEPWEALTGGYLVEGYGLSETSPVLIANPVAPTRVAGAVGLPLPSTLVRVVDPENPTVDVPKGERGELVVKGPQVFSSYWKKPEETAAVFTEGWFRTGDIVTIDEAGFVRVVDRIKEIIITGGFNVTPSEVEETLVRFAGVREAAVIGMPNDHSGEDVVAALVLEDGATLDEEGIRAFAREQLAAYKVPRRYVLLDELPKSIIGKVLRRKVRDGLIEKK